MCVFVCVSACARACVCVEPNDGVVDQRLAVSVLTAAYSFMVCGWCFFISSLVTVCLLPDSE